MLGRLARHRLNPSICLICVKSTCNYRKIYFSTQSIPDKSPKSLLHAIFKGTSPKLTTEGPNDLKNYTEKYFVHSLVQYYRENGHLMADIDPLNEIPRLPITKTAIMENIPEFVQAGKKLPISWLLKEFIDKSAGLFELVDYLEKIYAGKIGVEFFHIEDSNEKNWLANAMETYSNVLSVSEKEKYLELLTQSESFDVFLHKKFPQLKRYGLEGAEGMMIAMHKLLDKAANSTIEDVVICMPHRGRLNLLTGLLQLPPRTIFHKIKGNNELPVYDNSYCGTGDVLSHLGRSVDLTFSDKKVHCSLLHNPSHLEAVNPVAVGKLRAKAIDTQPSDCTDNYNFDNSLCVQLHGDGAFAGQGIVPETFQMANLPDFTVGGSIHLIVNNQLGFTCSSKKARSSRYASDIAKMIGCPIFHVNSTDPTAIVKAIDLAMDYRKLFKKDVVIDLIAYRKYGHNELDEPAFTQPIMYEKIRQRTSAAILYESCLSQEGVAIKKKREFINNEYSEFLEKEFEALNTFKPPINISLSGKWASLSFDQTEPRDTGVDTHLLKKIGKLSVKTPKDFTIHPRLQKHHVEPRLLALEKGDGLDWATAEALAFGSLMTKEKASIRLSGQDCGRGTFSHRHVQLTDQKNEQIFVPLNHMKISEKNSIGTSEQNGKLFPVNSYLSELAVLGFEYGYSIESPKNLVLWEAQFGDFFNGAQTIIDTFIATGEDKWLRQSGLVMLLPHGYDGAGPEHSSARIERFLQLSNDPLLNPIGEVTKHPNMHVVNPTTPAQYFHLLRRQIVRKFRKPLIVISPKTLLRLPSAVSSMQDFAPGTHFKPIIDDPLFQGKRQQIKAKKLILVSGKLYYDLLKERAQSNQIADVVIVRLEQLAPFPWQPLTDLLSNYKNLDKVFWCQEEPRNMGAFSFVSPRIQQLLPKNLGLYYIGRSELAAPATGISKIYKDEQEQLVKMPFI